MSARDLILSRIRRSLGVSGADPRRRATVAERLETAPRGVIPARGRLPNEERVELFEQMAAAAHSNVRALRAGEVPRSVAKILNAVDLPLSARAGGDPRLAALSWAGAGVQVLHGTASPEDLVGISHAEAGIAETGTLVIVAGADNPTLLGFLPPIHIIVVRATDIVADPESAFGLLRERFGGNQPARVVNFITGPSRSGDIELTMQLGAHGPGTLHVLITT